MLRALWNFESQFSTKQVFLSLQMTACFSKNDVWFWWKRRVVLVKTTCCFSENDVLFWGKRRVVLVKMTCCFGENDVWFSMKGRKRENTHPRNKNREQRIRIVKIPITPIPRAHAYTHITGVFAFLLSQVSQDYLQYAVNQISMVFFRQILTETGFKGGKHTDNVSQKSFFSFFRPPKFARFFPPNFPLMWHLWQQKINIAVGRRARTRVREKEKHEEASFCQLHHAK